MGVWQIVKKDVKILMRDRRALVLLLIMPLVLIGILGFSAGKLLTNQDDFRLKLALFNQDPSPLSRRLVEKFAEDDRIEVEEVGSLLAGKNEVRAGNPVAMVHIGPTFYQAVQRVELIDVLDFPRGRFSRGLQGFDIHLEPGSIMPWSRDALEQLLYYKTLTLLVPYIINRLPLVNAYINAYRLKYPQSSGQANSIAESRFFVGLVPSTDLIYRTLVPSYAVMFAFFLVNIMAFSFLGERNRGTLLRIQAAPVSDLAVIAGKSLPFLIISMTQGILLLAAGHLLFGMPLGSAPWMLLPLIFCTSVAATGLGLLVATLVRSETQVTSISTLLIIGLAAISGCLMPRGWMPAAIQQVSLCISPLSWSLVGYSEIFSAESPNFSRVLLSCGVLLLFATAFLSFGLWRSAKLSPATRGGER